MIFRNGKLRHQSEVYYDGKCVFLYNPILDKCSSITIYFEKMLDNSYSWFNSSDIHFERNDTGAHIKEYDINEKCMKRYFKRVGVVYDVKDFKNLFPEYFI
jgi:hypothetical protein